MHSIRNKLPDSASRWIQVPRALPQAIAADTLDDRVSESIFDVEDERVEIDIIARGMDHGANWTLDSDTSRGLGDIAGCPLNCDIGE
jgi:hypothetical protein